jgi:hypothetical protein
MPVAPCFFLREFGKEKRGNSSDTSIRASGKASEETREWAGNPRFLRIRFCLRIGLC